MYIDDEEEKRKFPIRSIIFKMVIVIIFIMLLIWLLPIFGSNKKIMNENMNAMKEAALTYYEDGKLPKNIGDQNKLSLEKMLELKLLDSLKDKSKSVCDADSSYVLLEKREDDYLMTIYLKCGNDDKSTEVRLNKYDYCKNTLCEKDDDKNSANKPTCSLEVTEGQLGVNDWYRSDVVVKFKNKKASNHAKITEYGIDVEKNYNNKNEYIIKDDGTTKLYGYVKDSKGKESTCDIVIKKDTKKPTCNLTVLNGSMTSNGVYVNDIEVGFDKKLDDLSDIDTYGISNTDEQIYNEIDNVKITKNGSHNIYGFVKDKAGNTNSCQISIKRQSSSNLNYNSNKTIPTCSLEVHSGKKDSNGVYTSDVVVKFKQITTNGSKLTGYGIGEKTTYSKNNTYTIKSKGTRNIYGFVKDDKGNTSKCSILIKRQAQQYEYQYSKTIAAKYSSWSNWNKLTYNPLTPPKFESTDTKQVENLGKSTTTTYQYKVGSPIYMSELKELNGLTEQVCKGYDYYRAASNNQTYAVKKGLGWQYQGIIISNKTPIETINTKYTYEGLNWNCGKCITPNIVWKKYTRNIDTVVDKNTLKSSSGSITKCSKFETGKVVLFNNTKRIVAFNQLRTEINKDVYSYRYRTRSILQKAYNDYKYSTSKNDKNLLNNGYKLTGKVRSK